MSAPSLSIWKDKIVLRGVPASTEEPMFTDQKKRPEYWGDFGKYCKYNEKFSAYLMSFSKQNLQRIYQRLGKIPVTGAGSQSAINNLKESNTQLAEFKRICEEIKSGVHDNMEIDYKLPPLALYQHRSVVFLTLINESPLFADCGCLSEDTVVRWNRAGRGYKTTLERLYKTFNGSRIDKSIPTKIRSFNGTAIQLNLIKKVVKSGIKKVSRLELSDGKRVELTPDHEVLTKRGWVEAGNLTLNDFVMVDNLKRYQKKEKKVKQKRRGDKRIAVGQYHKFARKQFCHEGTSFSYLVEKHRAIFEASVNNLTLKELISCTRSKAKSSKLFFVDTKTYLVHHLNEDHYDNRPENLSMMTKSAHSKLHAKGYANFHHGLPEYSKVKSVSHSTNKMTYDIVCEDPHRNFVANGMVVHNCGKTFSVLVSTQHQINQGLLTPGKILIAGKLQTLHSGWLEDTEKFTNLKAQVLWEGSSYKKKEKMKARFDTEADIYVINHEGLRIYQEELAAMNFEKVVIDESTILKSFKGEHSKAKGGVFGKALMEVARNAKWRVVMSGTPAPNGPHELWGQFAFLSPEGLLLERSFWDFRSSFMEEIFYGKVDKRTGKPINPNTPSSWVMKKGAVDYVSQLVNPYCFRVKIRDHLKELPEKTVTKRPVMMTKKQGELYAELRDKTFALIDNETISVQNKLSEIIKLRQVTGGFVITDQETYVELDKNPKMEMMDQLVNEEIDHQEKIVVFAQYQWEIESLESRYKNYGAVSVYGGNSSKRNIANIDIFRKDPACRVIVLHPRSAAHGLTLTMAHYMIFYSISYSSEEDYQSVRRVERAGQKHPMFIYYILADLPKIQKLKKATMCVDKIIYMSVQAKHEAQGKLLDGDSGAVEQEAMINNWRKYG